jgi:hypothetical protein
VHVIVLELIEGRRLSESNSACFTATERSHICDQAYEFCNQLNSVGLVWPSVHAGNFSILDGGTEVRALDFAACHSPRPSGLQISLEIQRGNIDVFLEDLGYGSLLKDTLARLNYIGL